MIGDMEHLDIVAISKSALLTTIPQHQPSSLDSGKIIDLRLKHIVRRSFSNFAATTVRQIGSVIAMTYESTITFTLDTICPWTYLAFLRLTKALETYRSANPDSKVNFTLTIAPYQLYPDFSTTGEDKYTWYRDKRYNGSDDLMGKYVEYMTALGKDEGVEMKLSEGMIAGTFEAHRILHVIQEEHGPDKALLALESLYAQYFCEAKHPSSPGTLHNACIAAGLHSEVAKEIVGGQGRGKKEVEGKVREQGMNGVDSVPYVVFEGRKRDFTLVGAKGVGEYAKILEQVIKEAI